MMKQSAIRVVQSLPLAIPAAIMGYGIVGMLLLVANRLYTAPFVVFGTLAAAGLITLLTQTKAGDTRPGSAHERIRWDVLVAIGIVLWVGCNIPFSAQHVLTDRDPATYAVTAAWLVNHHDLHIPVPAGFGAVPGVQVSSFGFGVSTHNTEEIYAQGAHLLPVLLGLLGRIVGQEWMLTGNVLFGGVALLAFYGFARLLLRPKWAALAVFTLAVTLPFIYFSRDTYTEPLTLAFIFSSFSCLWYAATTRDWRWWLLAGLSIGSSTLLRIDMYTLLAALEVYAAIYLVTAPKRERWQRLRHVASAAVPAAALGFLGWLDVTQLSSGYYRDERMNILAQIVMLGVLTGAAVIATLLAWKRGTLLRRLQQLARRRLVERIVIAASSVFFLALLVRALALLSLAVLHKIGDMPVESYGNDTTVLWIAWYIGPVLACLGVYRLIRAWPALLRGEQQTLLPLALAITAVCGLYILNPRITPDQVWASRRFLPVIFPGFIVLGLLSLQELLQREWLTLGRHRLLTRKFVPALLAIGVGAPLLTSLPFWASRPFAELSQIQAVCSAVPSASVLLWVGQEGNFAMQPTQAFCGVPSIATTLSGSALRATLPSLEQIAAAQGRHVYLGASQEDAQLLPAGTAPHVISRLTFVQPEHTYKRFPIRSISTTETIVLSPGEAVASTQR